MKNAFPYQFISDVILASDRLAMPRFLRDLAQEKNPDITSRLEAFFMEELQESSLQTPPQIDYFLFIVLQALQHQFYLRNLESFSDTLDLIRHRMVALRSVPIEVNLKAWEAFLRFSENAFYRLMRHQSREFFEREIDQLDWELFDKSFIPVLSATIGKVYLEERDIEQAAKARLWLQKAILESPPAGNLSNYLLMASYFLREATQEGLQALDSVQAQFSRLEVPEKVAPLFSSAATEMRAQRDLHQVFLEQPSTPEPIKAWERPLQHHIESTELPAFAKRELLALKALAYARASELAPETYPKESLRIIDGIIAQLEKEGEVHQSMGYRLQRNELAAISNTPLTEKDIKEVIQHYRKRDDYPVFSDAITTFTQLLDQAGNAQKSYEQILDLIKRGNKRLEQGGFYLLYRAMILANEVFLLETHKPGVSWMVDLLDGYFEEVKEIIALLDTHHEHIGISLIEFFREAYLRFEPVSHFNIKVYFMYQLYALKLIRLGTQLHGDPLGHRLATNTLNKLEDKNNPLSFIQANWEEFKNVPNDVRNSTLNKCINISKGDLPKAAEHLDFSYRNLRSYITFKEVNRLGFFLDLHETNNRQLEQGIRLMFHDLYKKGTIFEVVFDMPKFLVAHANTGFYSQDLEEELSIKGTTAKKYIKIMMETNLIRQDKTNERKHFYVIIRENIMKRLGKDLITLSSPEN